MVIMHPSAPGGRDSLRSGQRSPGGLLPAGEEWDVHQDGAACGRVGEGVRVQAGGKRPSCNP